jgi:hypothetical protein
MERDFEDFDMCGLRYNLAIETQNGLETIQSKSEFRPVVVLVSTCEEAFCFSIFLQIS